MRYTSSRAGILTRMAGFLSQVDVLHRFVAEGGSLLFLVGEGGDERLGSNVNAVTEGLGISVNADCVVRTVFHKYLHPKEVLITDGLLNRAVSNVSHALFSIIRNDMPNQDPYPLGQKSAIFESILVF